MSVFSRFRIRKHKSAKMCFYKYDDEFFVTPRFLVKCSDTYNESTNTESVKFDYEMIVWHKDYPQVEWKGTEIVVYLPNKNTLTARFGLPSLNDIGMKEIGRMSNRFWTNIKHDKNIPCFSRKAEAWQERIQAFLSHEIREQLESSVDPSASLEKPLAAIKKDLSASPSLALTVELKGDAEDKEKKKPYLKSNCTLEIIYIKK